MSLLLIFLRTYYKRGWRGSYRLIDFLSHRLESLQNVPIQTESGILHADLRISSARAILANPKSRSGEDNAMRKFVKKGDIVFDIGAHLGLYTLLLSKIVGREGKVFAFEPNSELLPSLRKTTKPLLNVKLHEYALSDRTGKVSLFVPEDPSMGSLADWTHGSAGNVHTVSCEMRRLDDLTESGELPIPQFIKCDVEGAELAIFSGGIKTLNRADAPIIIFEVNMKAANAFEADSHSCFDFLESLENPDYCFFEITDEGIKNLESFNIKYTNVVAIPHSKLVQFANKIID